MSGPVENVSGNSLNKLLFLLLINGLVSNEMMIKLSLCILRKSQRTPIKKTTCLWKKERKTQSA
jgi:hypothetical protein